MIITLSFSDQSVLFARLSNLAYKNPTEGVQLFNKAGFSKVTYFEYGGSNAYVVENDTDVVIACRGTEVKEWNDVKADLNIKLINSPDGTGKIHEGFAKYTGKIWEKIKTHVAPMQDKNLWVTGHSLGAAMATLMARECTLDNTLRTPSALFTYGSPRVGNRDFINNFNAHITHHRWVNDGDIVTKVPFSPWYYHCGTMHHIGNDGTVIVNYHRNISWTRVLSLLLPHGIFKLISGDAKDHSSELYIQKLSFWSSNSIS